MAGRGAGGRKGLREHDWGAWRARQYERFRDLGMPPAEAAYEAEQAERRARQRGAWVTAQMAAWKAATKACDEAWMELVREYPDDDDVEEPPEQAELDRIYAEIREVADHDKWPRHLYWGGI